MKYKILLSLIMTVCAIQARYSTVKNEQQFLDEINTYEFAVSCFFNTHDAQAKKDIQQIMHMFKAAANTDPYKKLLRQEVGFILVDVSKNELDPLFEKYVQNTDNNPLFLLFKQGKALHTVSGNLATLKGFVDKADLLSFIDDYFGKEFDTILAKKAEQAEQDRQMQLARYDAYSAYRYPYNSWAPYVAYGNAWGPYTYMGYSQFYPYGYGYNGYLFYLP